MKRGANRQTDEERAARNLEAQRKEGAKAGAFDRLWTTKEVHSVIFKITPSPPSSCIYKLRVEVNCLAFLSWTPSQGSQRIKALLPPSTNAYVPLLQSLFDLSWDISTLPFHPYSINFILFPFPIEIHKPPLEPFLFLSLSGCLDLLYKEAFVNPKRPPRSRFWCNCIRVS